MKNDTTDCYKCIHKRNVPGNCHIQCTKPDLGMTGNAHGVKNGWFIYPLLFDPIWKTKECDNFEFPSRVFLGGTCAESTWRDELIPRLKVSYFNPVVEDWTPECQAIEEDEKDNYCNIHLYVITSLMKGVFSIAEVIDSVHNKKVHTILQVMPDGFDKAQLKSLEAVINLVKKRGGITYTDSNLDATVSYLNHL